MLGVLWPATSATAQSVLFDVPGPGGSTLFHLNADAALVSRGVFGEGSIPVQGAGVRLMWYPAKGAFRAGGVDDRQWNALNVGDYSVAMGWNTTARGNYATAIGYNTRASGNYATAIGRDTEASGLGSTAMGYGTTAGEDYNTAMGLFTQASGGFSTTMGGYTIASGQFATAMGLLTTAHAFASLSLGRWNTIAGDPEDWVSTDPVLVVGNGFSPSNRSNAFTLLKNGNLTIAGNLTEDSDRRLKQDITPLTNTLNDLAHLQPVRYRFREGINRPEGDHLGLIAQEVAAVFPELVSEGADGYLSVSYTHLTAVLVQALNEQQKEIETLKARLARLENSATGSMEW